MNILLVGAYPPPPGGNSVHVKRLYEALLGKNLKCSVVDMYAKKTDDTDSVDIYRFGPAGLLSLLKCVKLLFQNNYDVIHFHASALEKFVYAAMLLNFFIPAKTRTVITIHSGQFSDIYNSSPLIKKVLVRYLMGRLAHIITVNSKQKSLLESIGISAKKIDVIPAYIPPVPIAFPEADDLLNKAERRVLIISSGYGEPLYGYHRILTTIKNNPTLTKTTSLLLCLYNRLDKEYMETIYQLMEGLESVQIVYDLNAEQFAYLLSRGRIYVRATDSDGDAVAIREAAHFGLTVIASNVDERPDYCHLFELDDMAGLGNHLLNYSASSSEETVINPPEPNVNRIFDIYSDAATKPI